VALRMPKTYRKPSRPTACQGLRSMVRCRLTIDFLEERRNPMALKIKT